MTLQLRQKKTVLPDRTVVLDGLPFEAGEIVEIIVTKSADVDPSNPYPLRGTPYRYDLPFEPVFPLEDWEESE